jgi:hypothetical protein
VRVQWTHHAKDRADERSGLRHTEIEKRCWDAYCGKSYGYWPKNKPRECWVAVDGPRGKATAIVTLNSDGDGILIVTIRESETCGQGERANEPMRHRPFAALGKKR